MPGVHSCNDAVSARAIVTPPKFASVAQRHSKQSTRGISTIRHSLSNQLHRLRRHSLSHHSVEQSSQQPSHRHLSTFSSDDEYYDIPLHSTTAQWGYDSVLSLACWDRAVVLRDRYHEIEQLITSSCGGGDNDNDEDETAVKQKSNSNEDQDQSAPPPPLSTDDLTYLAEEQDQLSEIAQFVNQIRQRRQQIKELQPLIAESRLSIDKARHIIQRAESEMSDAERQLLQDSHDARSMLSMALDETSHALRELRTLEHELLMTLLPSTSLDRSVGALLEVRAGVGGDEAAIFARQLWDMYQQYCGTQQWSFEMVESDYTNEVHGLRSGRARITCSHAPSLPYVALQFESGGHRVQRVPQTEAKGRVHTSAAQVIVLPIADEYEGDIEISAKDLRIDTFRSGGKGGQSVNTTDSAVRVTHLPTGLSVSMQDERSQLQNKAKALTIIAKRVNDQKNRQIEKSKSDQRSSALGSGDRSDRIRTYNFPQQRITDHRLEITKHGGLSPAGMQGSLLVPFIEAARHFSRKQAITKLCQQFVAPKDEKSQRSHG